MLQYISGFNAVNKKSLPKDSNELFEEKNIRINES